ncbi:MAG TPA: hypothetical protein VF950_05135 [Planctomycetota bacterium]
MKGVDLTGAIRSIWESRLGFDVRRAAEIPDVQGRTLMVVVRMEGMPRSAVIFECPAPLARRMAGRLRGRPSHAIEIEDVEEALGEIAALTGASLMPGLRAERPVAAIVDDGEDRPRRPKRELRREAFACEGQVFVVTLAS